ncbi:hypothetical protein SAMN05216218_11932 [Halorientalis regularis]|uniref:Uncharacterized protein n=1 Tax=Halorientalis regularis TaxID=660518 RepID=A0A1G7SMF8_9EURY|nr:hypothetical protein SAMN05216218_11932 [Halorientalis regularis]
MLLFYLFGQIEFREQACSNDLSDDIKQLCIVGRVVSKETERDFTARDVLMATATPDIIERLIQYIASLTSPNTMAV